MKNRIWKQVKKTGIAAVAAGSLLAAGIFPETVSGSEIEMGESPVIEQYGL